MIVVDAVAVAVAAVAAVVVVVRGGPRFGMVVNVFLRFEHRHRI